MQRNIVLSKSFTASSIITFLRQASGIFNPQSRNITDFIFYVDRVEKIDILGMLLIYKFIEYTSQKGCFIGPQLKYNEMIANKLKQSGFWGLIDSFMMNKDVDYKQLDYYQDGKSFFIAPIVLFRSGNSINENNFLKKVRIFYQGMHEVNSMIMSVVGEIILNFKEHADDDTQSIITLGGNRSKIEVACADTGIGIISSLKSLYNQAKNNLYILNAAMKRGVTSKSATNHMGLGLWALNEITKRTKGKFHVYTEGYYYMNDSGKITANACGFWKGTIIYLNLPLENPCSWDNFIENQDIYKINIHFA